MNIVPPKECLFCQACEILDEKITSSINSSNESNQSLDKVNCKLLVHNI